MNGTIGYNGTGYGIFLSGSHYNTLDSNTANNNGDSGIYLLYANLNNISGNMVYDNPQAGALQ